MIINYIINHSANPTIPTFSTALIEHTLYWHPISASHLRLHCAGAAVSCLYKKKTSRPLSISLTIYIGFTNRQTNRTEFSVIGVEHSINIRVPDHRKWTAWIIIMIFRSFCLLPLQISVWFYTEDSACDNITLEFTRGWRNCCWIMFFFSIIALSYTFPSIVWWQYIHDFRVERLLGGPRPIIRISRG